MRLDLTASAQAVVSGELDLECLDRVDDRTASERLTHLRGVGRWTAECVTLRGLRSSISLP